jgi:NADPH-dependent 2,4-dienoyl-CoA reductase/sulfur reductase-like enzyme
MRHVERVTDLKEIYDLIVVGAGPAGLAAAATAATLGASTLVLDENATPGGQIYRAIETTPLKDSKALGEDYWRGRHVVTAFRGSPASYAPRATAWSVSPALKEHDKPTRIEVGVTIAGAARIILAREVLLATGAMERPFPIPGWTLPGVVTAGAAQIALKTSGLVPTGKVVIAGTGPLLYLLAMQLKAAGVRIDMLLDTTPAPNYRAALKYVVEFLRSPYLLKGLRLMMSGRSGLRIIRNVDAIAAEGDGHLSRVRFERGGVSTTVNADILLLHQGVVPNTSLSNAAGCRHDWDDTLLSWAPVIDDWFASSVEGIAIAGDGAGIAGAESAALRGHLASLGTLARLGIVTIQDRDAKAQDIRLRLANASRGRRFLDRLYQPARQFRMPSAASTVVCRCEEVTAGQIRDAVAMGAQGPAQIKSFLRCGMGPCQARMCGLTVTEVIAEERQVPPQDVGAFRIRPPVKPVTVAELAALPVSDAAVRAVER